MMLCPNQLKLILIFSKTQVCYDITFFKSRGVDFGVVGWTVQYFRLFMYSLYLWLPRKRMKLWVATPTGSNQRPVKHKLL